MDSEPNVPGEPRREATLAPTDGSGSPSPLYVYKKSYTLDGWRVTEKDLQKVFKSFLKDTTIHFSKDGHIVWTLAAAVYPHTDKTRKASKPDSPASYLSYPAC